MSLACLLRHLLKLTLLVPLSTSALAATVVIHAAADYQVVAPLIADFEAAHPGIKVDYHDMQTTDLHQRFLQESEARATADIVWSSAMDLQMKLVNDGYARPHKSSETAALPAWARWKDEAFGTSFEPVCFAYNRRLLSEQEMPQTHAELVRLLLEHPERFRQRLVTYDPHRSGLGYLLHTQDLEANPVVFWTLIRQMSALGLRTEPTSARMLDRISSGEALLGYNVLCSYALSRARQDPRIAVVSPRDYTLIMSRISFISRYARNPAEAGLWMDYLLSRRGQAMLDQVGLLSVRPDVEGENSFSQLRRSLGSAFRPIVLNTGLLTYIDQSKRSLFLARWDQTLAGAPQDAPASILPGRRTVR